MWGYYRILVFIKEFIVHKFMILLVLFCGLFSNTLAANSGIDETNYHSKNALATSFTSNPAAAANGTITICQGQTITYTDTSTGVGTNPTYAWSLPGGNITSFATAGPHTITYNTSYNYLYKYK